ncbi:hypothetical protein [uncultured Mediterranean phage uvMED]|jgi:hypothetical protein|nr:hypothetical protein [uncultured Mediterranean phage uvMED]BAR17546.1 hypothetical protein [uncultured Mediterranean phage uvMED]
MCGNPFSSPSIPAPPPPPPEDESARDARKRMREDEQKETAEKKRDDLENRIAALYGTTGRRSLLTGRTGGQGFKVGSELMSNRTLGA